MLLDAPFLRRIALLIIVWLPLYAYAQKDSLHFTHNDSLRGSMNPARMYDVTFYYLKLQINIGKQNIGGLNEIYFTSTADLDSIQIDLFRNYEIYGVEYGGNWLRYRRDGDHLFAYLDANPQIKKGTKAMLRVHYGGNPPVAKNPPWDGGFVFAKDSFRRDWVGVACEGLGASSWWPCKDYLADEPDSMKLDLQVPAGMFCVSNGQLLALKDGHNGYNEFDWLVTYPINTYDVTLYIGQYERIHREYVQDNNRTALPVDFYLLDYHNTDQNQRYLSTETVRMLDCMSRYFGPYPFPHDGYALVEAPYWGMEHQGAIAYGNNFKRNAFGFDFIIVHESGHEWWGNNVSIKDNADMWLHEGFTTYSEALYVECRHGPDSAQRYLDMQKKLIKNRHPMVGPKGVNFRGYGDNDVYYKGTWILNTFRNVLANDSLWFTILRTFQQKYALQTISTDDFINYVNNLTGKDYSWFFFQYLRYPATPVLHFEKKRKGKNTIIIYRWATERKDFKMPVDIRYGNETVRLYPVTHTQKLKLKKVSAESVKVREDKFYIQVSP